MADGDKRTVIISANCHGRFLRRCLRKTVAGETYEFVWARHLGFRGQDRAPNEVLDRCAFVLAQTGHQTAKLAGKWRLPADCRIIRFPVVWLNSLWPTHCVDPRNPNLGPDERGPFPYGDRLILNFLEEGASPEQAVARWFEADPGQLMNLDRFHEINAAKARQLDKGADIKLGRFILGRFQRERLFVAYNHPGPALLRHMAKALLDEMGFGGAKVKMPRGNLEGVGLVQPPVHPKVAAHFKLEWYDPDALYAYFEEQLSAREYLLRYAGFAPIEQREKAAAV